MYCTCMYTLDETLVVNYMYNSAHYTLHTHYNFKDTQHHYTCTCIFMYSVLYKQVYTTRLHVLYTCTVYTYCTCSS